MLVPEYDRHIGIEVYGTNIKGISGRIKQIAEDFIVEEILKDGSIASVTPKKRKEKIVGEGENLVCYLVKKNWNTFVAIKEVATKLKVGAKRIRYVGIKDSKALTSQHISIWNIAPKEIRRVQIKDIVLWPFRFSSKPIRHDNLFGNQFQIKIRQIDDEPNVVIDKVNLILGKINTLGGFPNFFGHQRFSTINHVIGKKIVQRRYDEAVLTFLSEPRLVETEEAKEARAKLKETLDYKQALKIFPKYLKFEIAMLNYLVKHPKDTVNVFRVIPKKLGRLFIQAYQSYLFNRLLSHKLSNSKTLKEARIGDSVVYLNSQGLPSNDVKHVTQTNKAKIEEELLTCKACLALPIFGYKSRISDGIIEDIGCISLTEENIDFKNFYIPDLKEFSSRGTIRPVVTSMKNFELSEIIEDDLNPDKNAVKLSFSLRRGEYATIVLRELMKPNEPIPAGF